jgi:hypothetical protein
MFLWCACGANDVPVMPVGFLEMTFSRFSFSLTVYQHLKTTQINNIYLYEVQKSYNVTTFQA